MFYQLSLSEEQQYTQATRKMRKIRDIITLDNDQNKACRQEFSRLTLDEFKERFSRKISLMLIQ